MTLLLNTPLTFLPDAGALEKKHLRRLLEFIPEWEGSALAGSGRIDRALSLAGIQKAAKMFSVYHALP